MSRSKDDGAEAESAFLPNSSTPKAVSFLVRDSSCVNWGGPGVWSTHREEAAQRRKSAIATTTVAFREKDDTFPLDASLLRQEISD